MLTLLGLFLLSVNERTKWKKVCWKGSNLHSPITKAQMVWKKNVIEFSFGEVFEFLDFSQELTQGKLVQEKT